ncbi:hypothetical protein [Paracidovorax valerianellae]|uniref:hypothetical protein n=1 Tax=Paracidovorax valerianellae TaxID=187868 RepID=UPI00230479E4|nr:hypothetical protein [Paracidovorax valerianellae]MDA8446126.1 hypothetical protein [Paracidovorax valerianellae]
MTFPDFKKVPCIAWCVAVNVLLLTGWYLSSPTFRYSYNSPGMAYRLELYDPSILQRIIHYDLRLPKFARLYQVEPRALLGESEVVDMSDGNGEIMWFVESPKDLKKVRVGRDVEFKNIPLECAQQESHLPECQKNFGK